MPVQTATPRAEAALRISVDRAAHDRMIVLPQDTGAAGQIVRADAQRVDPGHRQDFLDRLRGADVLDLRDHDGLGIGVGDVGVDVAAVIGGAARAEAADSVGRIFGGSDQRPGLGGAAHHGRQHPIGAESSACLTCTWSFQGTRTIGTVGMPRKASMVVCSDFSDQGACSVSTRM